STKRGFAASALLLALLSIAAPRFALAETICACYFTDGSQSFCEVGPPGTSDQPTCESACRNLAAQNRAFTSAEFADSDDDPTLYAQTKNACLARPRPPEGQQAP